MNPIDKLNLYKDSFTKSELLIYNFIIKNPHTIIRGTIDATANLSNTSKSAIMRLCKKIGYDGFSEFKFELSRYIISMDKDYSENKTDSITQITETYSKHILALANHVTREQLSKITHLFKKATRIKTVGYNRTGLSAQQLRLRLSKLGFDCEAIVDPVLMSAQEDILKANDLVIIFSITGEATHYQSFCSSLKDNHCDIVLFTMNPKCPLVDYATETVFLPYISHSSYDSFLDDQAIFFVFIELFLSELANQTK